MSINTPNEINYLNTVNFETNFVRLPNTSFSCSEVTIPSLALGMTTYQSLFSDIPIEGDKINFDWTYNQWFYYDIYKYLFTRFCKKIYMI